MNEENKQSENEIELTELISELKFQIRTLKNLAESRRVHIEELNDIIEGLLNE